MTGFRFPNGLTSTVHGATSGGDGSIPLQDYEHAYFSRHVLGEGR